MDEFDDVVATLRSLPDAPREEPTMLLDDSLRFALWVDAYLRGGPSLDHTLDEVLGGDTAHHVVDLAGQPEAVPMIVALGLLKSRGAQRCGVALPAPGDPLGLAGPPRFNAEALDAEEAVIISPTAAQHDAEAHTGIGLVPYRAGQGVVWRAFPCHALRQSLDLREAETALKTTLSRGASQLAELGVGRWSPEAADQLRDLRKPLVLALPDDMSPRAAAVFTLALRVRHLVGLGLAANTTALSSATIDQRSMVLHSLDSVARRALVAATPGRTG